LELILIYEPKYFLILESGLIKILSNRYGEKSVKIVKGFPTSVNVYEKCSSTGGSKTTGDAKAQGFQGNYCPHL
jgi:hypothetical protein